MKIAGIALDMPDYTTLKELVNIDSPSGFTHDACDYIFDLLKGMGYAPEMTNKGAVRCAFGKEPKLSIAAHVDTLGAIVSGIKGDGTLAFSTIGGLSLTGAEGEYVRICTLDGKVHTGTILLNDPSSHTNREKDSTKRSLETMHIRLDEIVFSKQDVKDLGISVGDLICLYPRYEELENGYIKSRFLDNKAGCFVLFELAKRFQGKDVPVEIFFSNFEEVGHGGTVGYSEGIEELLVIDMGVLGAACEGTELSCSICAKDSTGPYDFEMRRKLVGLAKEKNIPYTQDVYPYYGSDGSAALRAGLDFRVGLIGPGVAASHSTERAHKKGIEATIDLCEAYIEQFTA
ncbi:Putative aminopeptidase FrvX [Rubritalea squalenifaciens DSM 18772]|uniref:Putative aminopeptidase FrvX n=1 Tax=Rubritalea squalenifaciens DSM 18772 TaxID=1123071 RepID=A0A1M6NS15_9BACT|nr:M42 family metallopeptidase [Rubritalea squalenifaciens]SHJ98456.1 Putative aminopeptidase FrvX [Rubritalea squalenifaciens DSM 18772]